MIMLLFAGISEKERKIIDRQQKKDPKEIERHLMVESQICLLLINIKEIISLRNLLLRLMRRLLFLSPPMARTTYSNKYWTTITNTIL